MDLRREIENARRKLDNEVEKLKLLTTFPELDIDAQKEAERTYFRIMNIKADLSGMEIRLLKETYPKADAIYQDVIINLIGEEGFSRLKSGMFIESCGWINGRKLYAL